MDTLNIIQKEGYRAKDLNEENQWALHWLRYVEKNFINFEYEDFEAESDSILGKIKMEIAEDVIQQVKDWLEVEIAEIQIGLAEGEK